MDGLASRDKLRRARGILPRLREKSSAENATSFAHYNRLHINSLDSALFFACYIKRLNSTWNEGRARYIVPLHLLSSRAICATSTGVSFSRSTGQGLHLWGFGVRCGMFLVFLPAQGGAMGVPKFDIFHGQYGKTDAVWVEAVEGLASACQRMYALATERPGPYFVFCTVSHEVLDSMDTTPLAQAKSNVA